jgi:hypothetical protein
MPRTRRPWSSRAPSNLTAGSTTTTTTTTCLKKPSRRSTPTPSASCTVTSRIWFGTYMEMISFYASLLLLHRTPGLLPCHFSYPLEIGHLKLHTVSDVNLSHSLGIVL